MSKLRIIVIGAGTMGRRHIEYLCASDACQLAAVCDSDSGAAALAARHEVPFFHDSIEALDLVRRTAPSSPRPRNCTRSWPWHVSAAGS